MEGLVVKSEDGGVEKRFKLRRRVSHAEEACPCRMRTKSGAAAVVTVVTSSSRGTVVVPVVESEDKICVMDECRGRREGGGGSLDRRHQQEKRFSMASTSSSVSRGDLNNNSNHFGRLNGHASDEEEGKVENRRNEIRERDNKKNRASLDSVSSFTKDIMRMIDRNTSQRGDYYVAEDEEVGDKKQYPRDSVNEEDQEVMTGVEKTTPKLERRPSEVILKMNRRNSDMSAVLRLCDCPCHLEVSKRRSKKLKSPSSPNGGVNIYSIEEPETDKERSRWRDEVVGLEKAQLEDRSDNGEDVSESEVEGQWRGDEYDIDEMTYEDEGDRRRRSAL